MDITSLSWLSFPQVKAQCRRHGIPVQRYSHKYDLQQQLKRVLVEKFKDEFDALASTTPGEFYPSWSLAKLKAELKTRKMPVSGTKHVLVDRLRDADWQEWDSRLKEFPQFSKLPVEIQEFIWQYSLPGPRILASGHTRSDGPNGLYFPKIDHTPNPAALQTCQLSRKIALKRYRLVFGTKNIYADLDGGDIFYIAPHGRSYLIDSENLWACNEPEKEPAATILADLTKVTHLLLPYSFDHYLYGQDLVRYQGISQLRNHLAMFKSLKTVSLSCGGTDHRNNEGPSGQVYVNYDMRRFKPMNADDHWSWFPKERMFTIKSHFYENLTEEEIARGIPECQLVEVHRIPDTPRRELQDANSEAHTELYVSLCGCSVMM
jgi:hypothetical protein